MTKPVHHRPFNLEHAKAGAPFCCADGSTAEVLKYAATRLWGTITNDDAEEFAAGWDLGGVKASGILSEAKRLVMTPLGYIDGKPVFVGDEFSNPYADRVAALPHSRDFENCIWPAPAKVYPETRMTVAELGLAYDGDRRTDAEWSSKALESLARVANAALRHAIDAGQVVVPTVEQAYEIGRQSAAENFPSDDPAEAAYWRFDARKKGYGERKGRPQSERDAFKAEYREAVAAAPTKEAYDQCNRDLGKAERLLESLGYRSAGNGEWTLPADCATVKIIINAYSTGCLHFLDGKIDPAKIIAKVPA